MLLAKVLVHAADLSNPVLPDFPVVKDWALLVCEEFTRQVNSEKRFGLPYAPHMDKLNNLQAIAKLQVRVHALLGARHSQRMLNSWVFHCPLCTQVGFISFIVAPLWSALVVHIPEHASIADNLARNKAQWQAIADEPGVTPIPPLTSVVIAPDQAPASSSNIKPTQASAR